MVNHEGVGFVIGFTGSGIGGRRTPIVDPHKVEFNLILRIQLPLDHEFNSRIGIDI